MLKKINKHKARKLFLNGENILIVPVNMNPISPWYSSGWYSYEDKYKEEWDGYSIEQKVRWKTIFDKLVFYYEYYNCVDSETGSYCAYYIEDKDD